MSDFPAELHYADSHEYVRVEGDEAVIGISDYAQEQLGDVVFVELPDVGTRVVRGEEAGVAESVKTASDIYAPLTGEVIAVNDLLEEAPETVNEGPYADGWFYRIKIEDPSEIDQLLAADGYAALVDAE